jgi:8-oxo-dGTP diphosphatase
MPIIRVAAGVVVRGGEVLICQRRPTDRHPGKWEFPGGKIEPGESAAACVVRELREELDIEVTPGRELWRTRQRYSDLEVELVFVHVAPFPGQARNLCFAEVRWVALGELEGYDFLDADRAFITRLRQGEIAL